MRAYITIVPDDWEEGDPIYVEEDFDACQPKQFRLQAGNKLTGEMPRNSDNQNTGTYDWFGFTYQPHVAVNRPNGFVPPPPMPPWQQNMPAQAPSSYQVPTSPFTGQMYPQQGSSGLASSPNPNPRG